jgi:hypothetical protein
VETRVIMQADPVATQRDETLACYRAKPGQVRSDARGEHEERREYAERPVLELLQNAEDALSKADQRGRVLFQLNDGILIVANEGAPFTPAGFRALCNLNDSSKQIEDREDRSRRMIGSKGTGFKAVLNWTDRIELFSGTIHALFDRVKAGPLIRQQLGPDGLAKLEEHEPWPDSRMPLLQVPLGTEADAEVVGLLRQRWQTIIRMRLLPDKKSHVLAKLSDLAPQKWLFLDRIEQISVIIEGKTTEWGLDRRDSKAETDTGERCYRLHISQNAREIAQYHVIRRTLPDDIRPTNSNEVGITEIGFAYQVEGKPDDHPAMVANFFATDCPSPFPAISVHATLLLKADRSRIADDDLLYQRKLIDALCDLAEKRLVPELTILYGPGALAYLDPAQPRDETDKETIETELQRRLVEVLGGIPFVPTIGGDDAAPRDLELWAHDIGEILAHDPSFTPKKCLPIPEWCDPDARRCLGNLGARRLEPVEHARLLDGWTPSSPEAACRAQAALASAYQEIDWQAEPRFREYRRREFCRVAETQCIWQTSTDQYRSLIDTTPFFEPRRDMPALPDSMRIDWLDSSFHKALQEQKLWDSSLWRELRKGTLHGNDPDTLLEHGILPALGYTQAWWQQNGRILLQALNQLNLQADDNNDVHVKELRTRISEKVRVPTRAGDWRSAGKVYAGRNWDNDWAEGFVTGTNEERYLLDAQTEFPSEGDWRPLLRYLGVSWKPKWRHHVAKDVYTSEWPENYLEIGKPPASLADLDGWQKYWESDGIPALEGFAARRDTGQVKRWPLFEAWGIEGLAEFVRGFPTPTLRLQALRELWASQPSRLSIRVGLRGPLGKNHGEFRSDATDGFVAWQIRHAPVFLNEGSPLFAQGEAALKDVLLGAGANDAWMKWLPQARLSEQNSNELKLRLFALDLGAKRGIGDYPASQWRDWLARLPDWSFADPPIAELKGLLRGLVQTNVDGASWGVETRLPCEGHNGTLEFVSVTELVVIDHPRFQPLRHALLEDGQRLLLASIKDGKELMTAFGCTDRAVSQLISASVLPSPPRPDVQLRLELIDRLRPLVFAWFEHAASRAAADRLQKGWPTKIGAHDPLQVRIRITSGGELGEHRQPFWWDGHGQLHICAASDKSLWDNLAGALKQCAIIDDPVEDGLVRLLEAAESPHSDNASRQFLLAKGLAAEDLERWEKTAPLQPITEHAPSTDAADERNDPEIPADPDQRKAAPEAIHPASAALALTQEGSTLGTRSIPPVQEAVPEQIVGSPTQDQPEAKPVASTDAPAPSPAAEPTEGSGSADPSGHAPPCATQGPESGDATGSALRNTSSSDLPRPRDATPGQDAIQRPSRPTDPSEGTAEIGPQRRGTVLRRTRGQEPRRFGEKAEKWFFEKLRGFLPNDYEIIRHDRAGPGETDFVILLHGAELLHIEAKAMSKDQFYWSQDEVAKAMECDKREIPYVIAVFTQIIGAPEGAEDSDADFKVRWIANPIHRLASSWTKGHISGSWRWKDLNIGSDEIRKERCWKAPRRPKRPAQNIVYVVKPWATEYTADGIEAVAKWINLCP